MRNYLDCGCCIEDGVRKWCPTCEAGGLIHANDNRDDCIWEWNEYGKYWFTGCGEHFSFRKLEHNPANRCFNFCPYCGKKIPLPEGGYKR